MSGGRKGLLDVLLIAALLLLLGGFGLAVAWRYETRVEELAAWEALYSLRQAQIAYREDPRRGAGYYAASLEALRLPARSDGIKLGTNGTYSEAKGAAAPPLRLYHNGTRDDTTHP